MHTLYTRLLIIVMLQRCLRQAVGFTTKQFHVNNLVFHYARHTQTTFHSFRQRAVHPLKNAQFSIHSHSNAQTNLENGFRPKLSIEEIEGSLGPNRKIVRRPFSWHELKDIVNSGDPTRHSRSLQVQEAYIFHMREVQQEWKSMNDYILYSKFDFDVETSEDGKKCARPTLEEVREEGRVKIRLLINEFPYYCQEGIEHYCLWKLGGPIRQDDIDQALEDLRNMRVTSGELVDVLYWVNPKHLQSIPDIDHAHFLCLRRDQK